MVLKGLQIAAAKFGASLVEDCEVVHVDLSSPEVTVQTRDGRSFSGTTLVLAAGPWSRQFSGLDPHQLPPVRPVKGQLLELKMERPFELQHVVRGAKAYLVPRSDGRLIVGATSEEMGFDTRRTAGGVYSILDGAWEMVPGIYDLELLAIDHEEAEARRMAAEGSARERSRRASPSHQYREGGGVARPS